MKRGSIALTIAALLTTLLPLTAVAHGAYGAHGQVPPGPTTRHQFRAEGIPVQGPFEIVHLVLDFAPGAWTPPHTHGGQGVVTVLEGTMTRRAEGIETVYRPGESWIEPGVAHEAGNATTERAAVMVTFLLPRGAPLTTVHGSAGQQAPPGPTTRHQYRTEGAALPGAFEVVHLVLDFAAGAWTPPHTHGGQGVVTVLGGTMTRRAEGVAAVFRPGESWIEPGVVHEAGNDTADPATVIVTFLLPKGAPLTTVATPGLPNTGMGGATQRAQDLWLALLIAVGLGAGGGLAAGGALARLRARRAGA